MRSKVQYVVDLSMLKRISFEQVDCDPFSGLCELRRFGRHVTDFVASHVQLTKIKKGRGKLNITQAMINKADRR